MVDKSLAEFYKSLSERNAQRSMYAPIGASVIGADISDPYASVGQNLGANLAKGLLGGFLMNKAQEEQQDYESNLTNQLRATLSGNSAFSSVLPKDDLAAISAFKLARDLEQEDLKEQMKREIMTEGLKAGAKVRGEQEAQFDMLKQMQGGSEADIELEQLAEVSPLAKGKVEATKRKEDSERNLNKDFLANPLVQEFKYKEQGIKALTEAINDPRGTSDYEIIRRTAQAVEPGLAVRLDDERSLQGAASITGQSVQFIKSLAKGESKLESAVRAGMLDIAKRSYNSSLNDYNSLRQNYLKRAEASKLNPEFVVPYGAGQPLKDSQSSLNKTALKDEYKALVKQLGDAEKAKAVIKQKYGGM